jgi:hypothetical protein
MDDELKGVKGWLLVFVLIMAVISPLINAFMLSRSFNALPQLGEIFPEVVRFEWILVGILTLIGWFVAWRLVAIHNWMSVRIAIAGIWIGGLGLSAVEFFGVSYFTGVSSDLLISGTSPAQFIRPVIFGVIWTAYLLKSERVENTYRDPGEQADVFE